MDSVSPQGGYNKYQNGGGIYHSELCGNRPASSPERNPKVMPRAPERSTSSREAVQRGLNAWHQYSLQDDPFGPPLQSTHSMPQFPTAASQRDIEQSIEALNMLMLDLDPINSHMSKSHSAPPGENILNASQAPFSQTLSRPSYQADSAIHRYNNSESVNGPSHQPVRSTARGSAVPNQSPVMDSTAYLPQRTSSSFQHQNTTPTHTPEPQLHARQAANHPPTDPAFNFNQHTPVRPANTVQGVSPSPDLQASSPYPGFSACSSPLPALTPQLKNTSSSSLPREQDGEEETLNLEGLVAHRIAGRFSIVIMPSVRP